MCVICDKPFGEPCTKTAQKVDRHMDKHFADLKESRAKSSRSSSSSDGGGFLEALGDILDVIAGN